MFNRNKSLFFINLQKNISINADDVHCLLQMIFKSEKVK